MKKNMDRYLLILIIIGFLVSLVLYGINTFKKNNQNEITIDVEEKIDDYDYSVEKTMTSEYKEIFKSLKELLGSSNVDEEKYVEHIAKLFVLDFYTLNDKINNTDIGGTEFVHTSIKDNFSLKATDTFYKYVENNLYGTRTEKLSIAKNVIIENIKTTSYSYNNTVDKHAYEVKVKWNYESDFGYETEKTLYFVHEGEKLSLVEMK